MANQSYPSDYSDILGSSSTNNFVQSNMPAAPAPKPKPAPVDTGDGTPADDGSKKAILDEIRANQAEDKRFATEQMKKIGDIKLPKAPPKTEAPKQESYQTDPMKTFGSGAMMIATLGSLLTRRPLTNALNAAAAVNQAVTNKDATAFSTAYQKWKDENDQAWKLAEWDQQMFKDELAKGEEQGKLHAVMTKNDAALTALQLKTQDDYIKMQNKALSQSKQSAKFINDFVESSMADWDAKHPGASEVDRNTARLEFFGKAAAKTSGFDYKQDAKEESRGKASISDDAALFAANQILAGDRSALSNYGRGEKATANLALIHEKIQERAKVLGISGEQLAAINAQYDGFKAEMRQVGSRAGSVTYAASEVDNLMPIAKNAVAKLDLSGFPDLASLQNYASKHAGSQEYQFAAVSIQELQNAFTSLLVRNGVRSDAAQNLAEHVINVNMGSRNIAGAFDAINQSKTQILKSAPDARKAIFKDMGVKNVDIQDAIPEDHVQFLINNHTPADIESFDKTYGKGTADVILSRIPQ